MSMKTKTTRLWQAVALAALVLAGSVAVPQAADAATKQVSCMSVKGGACKLTTKANGVIHFRVMAQTSKSMPFNVKTSSGKTLCSGQVKPQGQLRICSFRYSGTVKITFNAPMASFPTITAY